VFAKGNWITEIVELFTQFEIEDRQFLDKLMGAAQKEQASGINK
jgi:hypothetical protein